MRVLVLCIAAGFTAPALAAEEAGAPAFGVGLAVGGGVQTFMGDSMRQIADTALTWSVRAVLGTRSPLAVEVAYLGSRQAVEPADMGEEAVLLSHAFESDLRFNLGTGPLQPFLFAGLTLRRYQLTGIDVNRSTMANADSVVELPYGAGAAYRFGGLSIEGRAVFRDALEEELLPGIAEQTSGLDSWEVAVALGWEL